MAVATLHRLDRAAVAVTAAGSIQEFVKRNTSNSITISVLGASIIVGTLVGSAAVPRRTQIDVSAHGTSDSDTVTLADPGAVDIFAHYVASGSYIVIASLVDVIDGDFRIHQRFEPGSTFHVEVTWEGSVRVSFDVTMPALLVDCQEANQFFSGTSRLNVGAGGQTAFVLTVLATGSITGAAIPDLDWGRAQVNVYTQTDDTFPPPHPYGYWTFDHTDGAKIIFEYLGFATALSQNWGGVAQCETSNTRPSGFDLEGKLFAHGSDYPDSMLVRAQYHTTNTLADEYVSLTANPTFSHSAEQAGYNIYHAVEVRGTVGGFPNTIIFAAGILRQIVPAITDLRVLLDKDRLRDLGERMYLQTAPFHCAFHGWLFDAFELEHAATMVLDDGSSLTGWVVDTGGAVIISTSGTTVTLDGAAIGLGQGGVWRKWDFQKGSPGHAHRYMRIRFKVTAGSLDVSFEIWVQLGNRFVDNDSFALKKWILTASALNTWTEAVIDLCSPDSWGAWGIVTPGGGAIRTSTPSPNHDANDSIYPVWDNSDNPYWGITYHDRFRFEIVPGQIVEWDYSQSERSSYPVIGMYGGVGGQGMGLFPETVGGVDRLRPALRAHSDQKVALELWDAKMQPVSVVRTIAAMVAEVSVPYPSASSPARWRGWTANVMGSYPAFPDNNYLSASSPATWIGGGGVIYSAGAWNPFKDEELTLGVLTIPAQAIGAVVTWYPGAGDVFGWTTGLRGARIQLRAAHVLRAPVSGIVYDVNGDPVATETVEATPGGGSGVTDAAGEYQTGLDYLRGDVTYQVKPQTADYSPVAKQGKSNFHHRIVIRLPADTTGDWISRDRSASGVHVRAFERGGTIWIGTATQVLASDFKDLDTTIAGERPQVKFDRRSKNQRLWLFYAELGTGLLRARYSTDEGSTWSVANTIFTSGDAHDFVKVPGLRFFYVRIGSAISVKALDDADVVRIPETVVIPSGVDADVISVTEGLVQNGRQYIHLSYWAGGNLIEARSPDGIVFS